MNNLSIIIPSRNADNLFQCLEAIAECEPDAKVIVVDDGVDWGSESSNHRLQKLDQFTEFYIKVIAGTKPFVFARNMNLGIEAAGSDDVVLCNDDCLLETMNGFNLLQEAAMAHPDYGVIGAVTDITGQPLQKPRNIGLRQVPHMAFVCVLVPRRTIDSVGLLDERYCIDYGVEDRDYCEAVNQSGLKCGVHDCCFVNHSKLTSTFRGSALASRGFRQNWELFKQKWGKTDAYM